MTQVMAFLRRDFLIAASYRTAFVMQLASIFVGVPILFFMGQVFQPSNQQLEQYGGSFFAFLLIGIAFLDFHAVSLKTFSQSLRESQLMGTLELVLLSPTSLATVMLNSSIFVYLLTTLRFLLYLILGMIFGLRLENANAPAGALILLLGIVSFAALGILAASAIMIFKRGMGITTALSAASLFFGGVIYPIEALPAWLQPVSLALPITHALRGMRMALLNGAAWIELAPVLLTLLAFAIVLLPLSIWVFSLSVQRTKVSGTLSQY